MKKVIFIFLFFNFTSYSQNANTKFLLDGFLMEKPHMTSTSLCEFKKRKDVVVLDFIGNNWWKVKYNNCIGYVASPYLKMNDDLFRIEKDKWNQWKEEVKRDNDSIKRADSIKKSKIEAKRIEDEKKIQKEKLKKKDEYFNKCLYNTKEKDEFTGLIRENTILYKIHGYYSKEIEIQLRRYGGTKYIRIKSQRDLGCTSPYSNNKSHVKFKLENGDIVTFYHFGDIECGGFDLIGKLTSNDIYRLKKSPIKTVRLTGTEYYHDVTDLFFKDFFIKKLDCIK